MIESTVNQYTTGEFEDEWDLEALCKAMVDVYASDDPITPEELREEVGLDRAALVDEFQDDARDTYKEKEQGLGPNPETDQPLLRDVERFVILQVVDHRWREHLENMDYLREGVHLRSMAQKDPLVEYTSEGHRMFEELNLEIRDEVVRTLFHAEIEVEEADQLRRRPGPPMTGSRTRTSRSQARRRSPPPAAEPVLRSAATALLSPPARSMPAAAR